MTISPTKQRPARASTAFVGIAVAMGAGAGSQGLFALLSARWLPDTQIGAFFIGLSIVTLVGTFGRLGTEQLSLRDASPAWSDSDNERFASVVRTMYRAVVAGSVIASLLTLAGLGAVAIAFRPAALSSTIEIWLAVPTLVTMNLVTTGGSLLRSADRLLTSVLYRYLAVFAPALAIVAVSVRFDSVPNSPMLAMLVTSTLVAGFTWRQVFALINASAPDDSADFGNYRQAAMRLMVSNGLNVALSWSDRIILGAIAGTAVVGIYGVAWQLVLPFSLLLVLSSTITSPTFSRLHAADRLGPLETTARTVSLWMLVAAIATGVGLVLASAPILSRLGDGFEAAQPIVVILVLAQIVNLGAGPIGQLYIMSKRDDVLVGVAAVSAAVSVLSTTALTLGFGPNGTAAGVAIGLAAKNISLVALAPRLLGVAPVVFLRRQHEPVAQNVLSLLLG